MSDVARRVAREGWWAVPRADAMLLAIAMVAGSLFLGTQLGEVAARPTEFAECAEFSADWFQRREGYARPIPREQLVAAIEKARGLGEAEDAARLVGMLSKRDDVVMSMCSASN